MSRRDEQRFDDILAAVEAIHQHLDRGGLDDGLVFDAVRVRLIEIGELMENGSGAGRVVLDQSGVVIGVDVAARQLGVEIIDRSQEEVSLGNECRASFGNRLRHQRSGPGGRSGRLPPGGGPHR